MFVRLFFILLPLFATSAIWAQSAAVTITATLEGCEDLNRINLSTFEGLEFSPTFSPTRIEGQTLTFKIPKTEPRYYYLGGGSASYAPFILGSEDNVVISGSCRDLRSSAVSNSPLNDGYASLKQQMNTFQQETRALGTQYAQQARDPESAKPIAEKMAALDDRKLELLDSLRSSSPFLADILAINTYLSFPNYGRDFSNELDYFANMYFQQANLSDKSYNHIAYLHESFKNYTSTLASVNIPKQQFEQVIGNMLSRVPNGTRAHRYALGGILAALQSKNHPSFVTFGELMVSTYSGQDVPGIDNLQTNLTRMKSRMVGGEAPDFTQNDPDGNPIQLSDLRGKVVLLDFWASWCGPCRRENPNVVKLYEAYKDKGFEILGISLDKDKGRWLQAIEKDGLKWLHVSDLKGWKNEVGQLYGVSSIPHTVLLDAEGRIISQKLRGPALEQKVAEILGAD
jgi:peroxiredoxin